MKLKFQSPTGMRDILDEDYKYYEKIEDTVKSVAKFYGFKRIETPILEQTDVFSKGIGLATDVVQKEMYSFGTKGGTRLTLRPEGTAPIVRAYIENGMHALPRPVKLWHFGPYFRHEKPQAGRTRQFWQFGLEAIGEENPVIDAEIVQIFFGILKELKIKNVTIDVNSIGASCCRPYYKKLLASYFRSRSNSLCVRCKKRLKENPLRILDCKEERCHRIIFQAPQTVDHLCQNCRLHFKEFLEFMDELELPYNLNPYLVRGLDYYTRTVFEFFASLDDKSSSNEKSEENSETKTKLALGGGGRYDGLVKLLGGKDTPAIGVAGGVERIMSIMRKEEVSISDKAKPQVFLVQLGKLSKRKSLKLMEEFRKANIPILESMGRDSLRAQLNIADRVGVTYSLILGQKESLDGTIIIRYMDSGKQKSVKLEDVVKEIKKLLKKK
jgi:histidyl-tRNA synthetase